MTEIEVKILEIDPAVIQQRLLELGAKKVFEGDMQGSQFDFPDYRLDKNKSFLRVRSKGDEVEMTFKKREKNEEAKQYQETEVVVSDRELLQEILQNIGMIETVHGRSKHRISYALDDAHFEIDTFEGMPTFLEIEVSDQAHLEKWVTALGYTLADTKPYSGRDIVKHYGFEYP